MEKGKRDAIEARIKELRAGGCSFTTADHIMDLEAEYETLDPMEQLLILLQGFAYLEACKAIVTGNIEGSDIKIGNLI